MNRPVVTRAVQSESQDGSSDVVESLLQTIARSQQPINRSREIIVRLDDLLAAFDRE